jgi:hypothetical protein
VIVAADRGRRDDGRYLEAAIGAATSVAGIGASVTRVAATDAPTIDTSSADWLVWLADAPPPPRFVARARHGAVLLTQEGRDTLPAAGTPVVVPARAVAAVRRRAPFDGHGAPVWTDGAGTPLLTVAALGEGLHYRLYLRLTPEASDLVLHGAFAEAITALWLNAGSVAPARAARISLAQALPARGPAPAGARPMPPGARSLAVPLWVLAALLLALERWLVFRRTGAIA